MIFRFDCDKSIQAAATVLKHHGGQATRMRVLKLLYIADRELLQQNGRTITGDHPYAFEHGPVLDLIYNLMKGTGFPQAAWDQHIARAPFGSPSISLVQDPGIGSLNRHEIEKLQEVSNRYAALDEWDLSLLTHRFAEWDETYPKGQKTSVRIPEDRLLAAVGRLGDQVRLEDEAAADQEWANLMTSLNGEVAQTS